MTVIHALTALGVALCTFAALSGLTWMQRVIGERPGRRRGMVLNLARRAGPPVLAGIAVAGFGVLTARGIPAAPALLLIGGGLAFGLHHGLADVGQADRRSVVPRVAIAVAAGTGYLWLAGLAGGAPA
jgi:hypothetical protein